MSKRKFFIYEFVSGQLVDVVTTYEQAIRQYGSARYTITARYV